MTTNESKKLWLIINGKVVTDHKIEASTFGKLLTNLQHVIDAIQEAKFKGHIKKDFILYLTHFEQGSVAAALQPSSFQTDLFRGSMVFEEMVNNLEDLITTLIDSTDGFKTKIDEEFQLPYDKIRFLESFRGMLSKRNKFTVSVGYDTVKPSHPVLLPAHREGYIKDLISEYYEKSSVEVKGIIMRVKGDDPRSFTIKTETNDTIRCVYTPETEKDVMNLFKSPVIVRGLLNKRRKLNEIEMVKDVCPFTLMTLTELGEFSFLQPLSIRVSYHDQDEQWCLENDELTLSGYGNSFGDASVSLKESLESLIVGILAFDEKSLTDKSREIKKNLQKFLNLDQINGMIDGIEIES
jgi:hypothetical protein